MWPLLTNAKGVKDANIRNDCIRDINIKGIYIRDTYIKNTCFKNVCIISAGAIKHLKIYLQLSQILKVRLFDIG